MLLAVRFSSFWTHYGKIDVHEVKFIKDGAFINARIPTKTSETVSIEDIDKFIDSFSSRGTR